MIYLVTYLVNFLACFVYCGTAFCAGYYASQERFLSSAVFKILSIIVLITSAVWIFYSWNRGCGIFMGIFCLISTFAIGFCGVGMMNIESENAKNSEKNT